MSDFPNIGMTAEAAPQEIPDISTRPVVLADAPISIHSVGGKQYRPELDAVRFIAFFAVFLHHKINREVPSAGVGRFTATAANAFAFGLCLFFVLSAYLISDLLMRERVKTGTVDLRAFFKRRVLRIWPLYILGLLIGTVLALEKHDHIGLRFLAYFLMVGNWYVILNGPLRSPNAMQILWSISIEEQFYLFWPGIAKGCSRRAMYVICAVLIVIANAWLFYFGRVHADLDTTVWYNSFVQFEMFAAGILVALALKQRSPVFSKFQRAGLLLMWPVCWYCAIFFFHCKQPKMDASSSLSLMIGYALAAAGSAALLLGLLGISKRYIPSWLAYLGRISYGLYVYHLIGSLIAWHILQRISEHSPIYTPLSIVISLVITIGIAAVSYRYFESPFLRRKPERI